MTAAGIHRRCFLVGAAGTAGAVATIGRGVFDAPAFAQDAKPLPIYVSWKDEQALIVHSDQTIETERAAVGTGIVTPEDRLFARNNVSVTPESVVADRDAWQVEFEGVSQPKSLSVSELKTMGLVVVATVLQCSGNGRKYFQDQITGDQKISGTPWTVGAAGCVLWTGVPLDLELGEAVFLELAEPPCAICHALADAEAVGDIGPNLDDLNAGAERIEVAVSNGIGVMPAYGELLTKEQIEAVAQYVVSATTK